MSHILWSHFSWEASSQHYLLSYTLSEISTWFTRYPFKLYLFIHNKPLNILRTSPPFSSSLHPFKSTLFFKTLMTLLTSTSRRSTARCAAAAAQLMSMFHVFLYIFMLVLLGRCCRFYCCTWLLCWCWCCCYSWTASVAAAAAAQVISPSSILSDGRLADVRCYPFVESKRFIRSSSSSAALWAIEFSSGSSGEDIDHFRAPLFSVTCSHPRPH